MDNESKVSRLGKDTTAMYYLLVKEDNEKTLSLLIKIIPTERVTVSKSIKTIFDRVSTLTHPGATSKESTHDSQTI